MKIKKNWLLYLFLSVFFASLGNNASADTTIEPTKYGDTYYYDENYTGTWHQITRKNQNGEDINGDFLQFNASTIINEWIFTTRVINTYNITELPTATATISTYIIGSGGDYPAENFVLIKATGQNYENCLTGQKIDNVPYGFSNIEISSYLTLGDNYFCLMFEKDWEDWTPTWILDGFADYRGSLGSLVVSSVPYVPPAENPYNLLPTSTLIMASDVSGNIYGFVGGIWPAVIAAASFPLMFFVVRRVIGLF